MNVFLIRSRKVHTIRGQFKCVYALKDIANYTNSIYTGNKLGVHVGLARRTDGVLGWFSLGYFLRLYLFNQEASAKRR